MMENHDGGNKKMNLILWVIQGLLAFVFLLAGSMKAFRKLPTVKKKFPWANELPAALVRLIGIAELLEALGLIGPVVTGMLPWVTVAAAGGLVIVMLFASVFNASRRDYSNSGMNAVLLLLAAFIVLGRWVLASL